MRKLARLLRVVVVDPDANLVPAMRAGAFGLRHGRVLILYPEGERSIDGSPKTFKKGAAEQDQNVKAGCFRPRHGIRVTLDGKTSDFVICFECWQVKVYEGGVPIMALCVQSVEPIPDGDAVLMHKLMIEGNEQEYLRIANRFEPTLYGFIAIRPRARL